MARDTFSSNRKTYLSWGYNNQNCLLQVKLADRSLLPGDVVKFSDVHKGTQKGFVGNVQVVASVKVLVANQIFHNLDCKELSPLQVLYICRCILNIPLYIYKLHFIN